MIGVILDNINSNPFTYKIIKNLNILSQENDVCVFANNIEQFPIKPLFSIFQYIEALAHKGTLISTSILNSQVAIKSLTAQKKYFYMWTYEWVGINNITAKQIYNILHNPELSLITRDESYKIAFEKLFNKKIDVIHNFDHKELLEVIGNE